MQETLLSGYRHHPFSLEQELSNLLLKGQGDSSIEEALSLETYADVLGPDRLRAAKNALICFVAVVSRSVISKGVDSEKSFSISDYYINCIEKKDSIPALETLLERIKTDFRSLAKEAAQAHYSLPVQRAIAYIKSHVYGNCRVDEIARTVGYNPQYLATVFKEETGSSPLAYIREQKMKEARELLLRKNYKIYEIAHSLGYCNASYFIREFKRFWGMTPKQVQKKGEF